MRYAKLSCTEFYPYYLQQCYSIDLFSYRTPGHGQKGHMNKVCPSFCSEVFMELALFFVELKMVLGAMWCYVWQWDFLKKMFYLQNGENRPTPGFFECIGKLLFLSSLFFFISLIYNESSYYCNSCMLEQIFSYLGKFWYLRYGPKFSWPTRLQDFSIAGL